MRRVIVIGMVLTCVAALSAGCARRATAEPAAPAAPASAGESPTSAGDWPAGVKEAEVYTAVLRRYLGTSSENSFADSGFRTVYVLDRAVVTAADPMNGSDDGTLIAQNARQQVITALAGTSDVVFVSDRDSVLDNRDGCAQVKNGGILITLGPPDGDDNQVTVAVNGFVACMGATWLTYVVRNEPGTGWRVTGTTGSMAIA